MIVENGPLQRLVIAEAGRGLTPVRLGYTSIKPYLATVGGRVGLIGSSPTRAQEVALVEARSDGTVDVLSATAGPASPPVTSTGPNLLRHRTAEAEVTVIVHEPAGTGWDWPAPLIVRAHAGPTYHSEFRLDGEVQFFTSHGFAVADVDYRGSSGYGRAFRTSLHGRWGGADVEDCRNAALRLLRDGRAMPGAVFISGASAGGYTALRAGCGNTPFVVAVARSAIVDPARWTLTAPRFQRPHARALLSPDGRIDPDDVTARVLIVHGTADSVAPFADTA